MRYLKGLIADCITMAVIIIILFAATAVTNGMINNLTSVGSEISFDNLTEVVSFSNLAIILVPELAAVGAMASGSKIAHDIMGA